MQIGPTADVLQSDRQLFLTIHCSTRPPNGRRSMQFNFNSSPAEYRNPARSETVLLKLELASTCDGIECDVTSDEGVCPPPLLPTHWHLYVRGEQPKAGPQCYLVAFEHIEKST
jgi:hypothetical protein